MINSSSVSLYVHSGLDTTPTITLMSFSYTLAWRLNLANLDGMQRPGLLKSTLSLNLSLESTLE